MLVRSLLTTLIVGVAVAGLAVGCGGSNATHDAAATYSPASLAQELIFQYRSLDPGKRDVPKPAPRRKPEKSATKEAKATPKEAPATTLDDLIRDIRQKAALVPGMSVTEAMTQTANEVDKDTALPEADRKTITDRLRAPGE